MLLDKLLDPQVSTSAKVIHHPFADLHSLVVPTLKRSRDYRRCMLHEVVSAKRLIPLREETAKYPDGR
jgi:hypothetical protein